MTSPEVRDLESFVAVAESLHFREAASSLHTSQPVLSRAIARLERQLGVRLFDRTTRRVTLTPAGEAFLGDSRRLLADLKETIARIRRIDAPEKLTVAIRPGTGQGRMAQIIAAYQRGKPEVPLDLHFTYAQETALRDGTAQIALTCQVPDLTADLASVHVEAEAPVVLLPRDHPLAERASVAIADLSVLSEFRPQAPLQPTELLIDQVAMGLLVVIMGSSTAIRLRESVVAVPVVDAPGATLRLAWLPTVHDPVRDRFLAVARGLLID
jgi:DNA-binding transcriptional LysR family regulator